MHHAGACLPHGSQSGYFMRGELTFYAAWRRFGGVSGHPLTLIRPKGLFSMHFSSQLVNKFNQLQREN
jgi:hypothetical protein